MSRRKTTPALPVANPSYRYTPPRQVNERVVELDGGWLADVCRANREADERARRGGEGSRR